MRYIAPTTDLAALLACSARPSLKLSGERKRRQYLHRDRAPPTPNPVINLAGATLLLGIAVLPVAVLPLWNMTRVRPILLGLCWVLAVGFTMHALVDDIQRVLSLAGVLHLDYPLFSTVNRRVADLQDLLFNETWFLVEGVLWGVLGWINLGRSAARRWWIGTAFAAIAVLTCFGLLAAFGVIGKIVIG